MEAVVRRLVAEPQAALRLLLGGVLMTIPVVQIVAFGYLLRVVGRVRAGEALWLPDWDDGVGLLRDGLFATLLVLAFGFVPVAVGELLVGWFGVLFAPIGLAWLAEVPRGLALVAAPVLVAAAWNRYLWRRDLRDVLALDALGRMIAAGGPRLLAAPLAFVGLLLAFRGLYGFVVFGAGLVVAAEHTLLHRAAERARAGR